MTGLAADLPGVALLALAILEAVHTVLAVLGVGAFGAGVLAVLREEAAILGTILQGELAHPVGARLWLALKAFSALGVGVAVAFPTAAGAALLAKAVGAAHCALRDVVLECPLATVPSVVEARLHVALLLAVAVSNHVGAVTHWCTPVAWLLHRCGIGRRFLLHLFCNLLYINVFCRILSHHRRVAGVRNRCLSVGLTWLR
mmetsp:Transcript_14375/g.36369  ORF Transcript_14375/g.36369 Transcript_14375/m.36369 type:complete len:201 (-) Transcript_14375:507-1109(-)